MDYIEIAKKQMSEGKKKFKINVPYKHRDEFNNWLNTVKDYSTNEESHWFKKYQPDDLIPFEFTKDEDGSNSHSMWK